MQLRNLNLGSALVWLSIVDPACVRAGQGAYASLVTEYRTFHDQRRRGVESVERALHAERLDRRALISAVLDRNPSVEAARQAWRAALERYRQTGAWDEPMLAASLAPLSLGANKARLGYEVEINQRVPLGGKLDAQAALAAAEAQLAASDFSEARSKLALMASDLYDDYVLALRSLEIQAQHVALMRALQDNTLAGYASGHTATQDALQAEGELARLEYQITAYETQRDLAIARMNALLHRDPGAPLPPPRAEDPLYDKPEELSADDVARAVERRPDAHCARARLAVAHARAQAADAEYFPDLTLSASYNSMWDMPEHRFMTGVALSLPLQRERRSAALSEAAALRAASESELQSVSDSAQGEIAVARRQLAGARRAALLYEQRLLPLARQRIEAARAGFITGGNNFMAVIEAERGLRSAELELEMARADLRKSQAALERALGRLPGPSAEQVTP